MARAFPVDVKIQSLIAADEVLATELNSLLAVCLSLGGHSLNGVTG